MKSWLTIALTLLIAGCASTEVKEEVQQPVKAEQKNESNDLAETPVPQRIYYFQHKLISDWLYQSDGALFFDLQHGNTARLLHAASELVSPEYADGIYVRPIEGANAVAIKFPKPEHAALCYYALILKAEDRYSYITYEKAMGIKDDAVAGEIGVVGSWDSNGNHQNHGLQAYRSESEFIADNLGKFR